MPYNADNKIIVKGYYTNARPLIIERHGNIFGHFILSLDYIKTDGINKSINTTRIVETRRKLEDLLDRLFDIYGNYHLNYLIIIDSILFDNVVISKLRTELNKVDIMANNANNANNALPQQLKYDRNKLFNEFYKLKDVFKTKQYKDINLKMLFVNENIYSIYNYTGMNNTIL